MRKESNKESDVNHITSIEMVCLKSKFNHKDVVDSEKQKNEDREDGKSAKRVVQE